MAEINTATDKSGKAGVRKSKKLSTKVDLTPMVDLGFLLITFFMINVHMTKPVVADLKMPADSPDSSNICESCALTVVPIKDDKVIYYHGDLESAIKNGGIGITNYSLNNGIGDIIRDKQAYLDRANIKRKEMMLIIKPGEDADYGNIVDLFDEVLINLVDRYAIVNLAPEEKSFLKAKGFLN